jgi:hypothetical protein
VAATKLVGQHAVARVDAVFDQVAGLELEIGLVGVHVVLLDVVLDSVVGRSGAPSPRRRTV